MTTTTDTTTGLPLRAGRWTLDPTHATVTFWIRHLGVAKVRGRFDRFDAALDVGPALDDVRVSATIDVASVDTGNADRDAHLLSTDYLDTERFPQMTFASTAISGAGADWRMDGELTINGTTRPVSFAVEFGGEQEFFGSVHAGFAAEGVVDRRDYGLVWKLVPGAPDIAVGDLIHFQLDLEFVAPAGGTTD
jgi:polyisoprenoid-binding protein YceI